MWLRSLVLAVLLALVGPAAASAAGTAAASAAPPPVVAGAPSQEQVRQLLDTLKDPAARDRLIATLEALVAVQQQAPPPQTPVGAVLDHIHASMARLTADLVTSIQFVIDLPHLWDWLQDVAVDPARRASLVGFLEALVLVLGAGVVAELIVARCLRRPRLALEARIPARLSGRIVVLIGRVILTLLPIAAFAIAATMAMPWLSDMRVAQLALIDLVTASIVARTVVAAARLVLAPEAPQLAVLPITPETAAYLFVWIRRIANLAIYGWFTTHALLQIGLPPGAYATLCRLVGLAATALCVVVVMQNRAAVAAAIRGRAAEGQRSPFAAVRARIGDVWHVLAIVYLVGLFVVWALDVRGGFAFVFTATAISVVAVVGARLMSILVQRGIDRAFSISEELEHRLPGLEARANRYVPVLRAGAQAVIAIIAAMVVLEAWGIDAYAAMTSPTGATAVGIVLRVALILVLGAVAWELFSAFVERALLRTDANGMSLRERSARARTLLPLLRTSVAIVLAVVVGLSLLSQVGVDIGPLLAGAGILGVAIGFGSQSLVHDIITGVFILVEDTVAVGEVVKIGGHAGVVEAMSLRSIRLRDLTGTIHTLPFSSVSAVENMTRDFSFKVVDVGIAYRENTDEVTKVIKRVADELVAEPDWAAQVLGPPEIFGVDALGDSAVNIRVRFKTRPGKQWGIGREFNRRIKLVFDEEGIEIPFPHRTIYFGVDQKGEAPPAHLAMVRRRPANEPAPPGPSPAGPSPGAPEAALQPPAPPANDAPPAAG